MYGVLRFMAMWSDVRNAAVYNHTEMRCNLDIAAWNRRLASISNICAKVVRPVGPLDMLIVRHPTKSDFCATCGHCEYVSKSWVNLPLLASVVSQFRTIRFT